MKKPEIWIIPSGLQWLVVEQGRPGNLGVFVLRSEALERGRQLARERHGLLFIRTGMTWCLEPLGPAPK